METSGIYVRITFPNDSIKYGLFTNIRVFDKRNNIEQVRNTSTRIHFEINNSGYKRHKTTTVSVKWCHRIWGTGNKPIAREKCFSRFSYDCALFRCGRNLYAIS